MIILVDNGHGKNTLGKCSPDKRLLEWRYTREIADMVIWELKARGYNAVKVVDEDYDVPLSTRCRRVNTICNEVGAANALVVSIHCDAAGADGQWHSARGFSARVALNASNNSKRLAKCLWDAAIGHGLKGNRAVPTEGFIAQNLAICRDTKCPAVLTENLFMDNKEDVAFMLTEKGKKEIALANVEGIINYIKSL